MLIAAVIAEVGNLEANVALMAPACLSFRRGRIRAERV